MATDTKLMLLCALVMGGGMALCILRVLGAWVDHHVKRHDLIVESKRRRAAYLQALADRDKAEMQELEAEDPATQADVAEPEPALAA